MDNFNFIGTVETLEALDNQVANPGDFIVCLEDEKTYENAIKWMENLANLL